MFIAIVLTASLYAITGCLVSQCAKILDFVTKFGHA